MNEASPPTPLRRRGEEESGAILSNGIFREHKTLIILIINALFLLFQNMANLPNPTFSSPRLRRGVGGEALNPFRKEPIARHRGKEYSSVPNALFLGGEDLVSYKVLISGKLL